MCKGLYSIVRGHKLLKTNLVGQVEEIGFALAFQEAIGGRGGHGVVPVMQYSGWYVMCSRRRCD